MKEDIVNARKEKVKHTQETDWMKEEVKSIYSESTNIFILYILEEHLRSFCVSIYTHCLYDPVSNFNLNYNTNQCLVSTGGLVETWSKDKLVTEVGFLQQLVTDSNLLTIIYLFITEHQNVSKLFH